MSHAPAPKCWTCAKPMLAVTPFDERTRCTWCRFHSCGECIIAHVRRAHPSAYMEYRIPAEQKMRLEAAEHPLRMLYLQPPPPDNVVQLFSHKGASK